MPESKVNWRRYTLEFLSIFIAVVAAFALDHWNDNRRDRHSEQKILREVRNGLLLDLQDIANNKTGHRYGIRTCHYFRDLLNQKSVAQDSVAFMYTILLRDFNTIFNKTGYESLKSKGLEIVRNDSVRFQIISLYDYYYQILYKIEEEAHEMQSFKSFFGPINDALSPYMEFDEQGNLVAFNTPVDLEPANYNAIMSYLWRIENNRKFKMARYHLVEQKVQQLIDAIESELEDA